MAGVDLALNVEIPAGDMRKTGLLPGLLWNVCALKDLEEAPDSGVWRRKMRGLLLRVLVFIGLTCTASALYAVPYLSIQ